MVRPEDLAALDLVVRLRTGGQAALPLHRSQSTVSRRGTRDRHQSQLLGRIRPILERLEQAPSSDPTLAGHPGLDGIRCRCGAPPVHPCRRGEGC
ncbi:MAG: hypothetical protein VKI81_03150 [Synechococcaceae cyanobacterium]|nr:hypothetical protein [Synechococcaceae cyanobacterium]